MGVLEWRKDADSVGYDIIGEDKKEPSDVIDYNINDEQTKDAFAKANANNDTTTGMATVIPGVNAPKLLEDTSIISSGTDFCQLTIGATGTMPSGDFNYFDNLTVTTSCPSVRLDDNKTDIYFAAGIYIIYVFVSIHRGVATFIISGHYRYPDGEFDRLIASNGDGDNYNMYCAILKSDGTGYVRIGITPTENVTNLGNSFIRIAKIG